MAHSRPSRPRRVALRRICHCAHAECSGGARSPWTSPCRAMPAFHTYSLTWMKSSTIVGAPTPDRRKQRSSVFSGGTSTTQLSPRGIPRASFSEGLLDDLFGTLLQARPQPFVLGPRSLPFLPLWLRTPASPPPARGAMVYSRDRRHPLGERFCSVSLASARWRVASRRSTPLKPRSPRSTPTRSEPTLPLVAPEIEVLGGTAHQLLHLALAHLRPRGFRERLHDFVKRVSGRRTWCEYNSGGDSDPHPVLQLIAPVSAAGSVAAKTLDSRQQSSRSNR